MIPESPLVVVTRQGGYWHAELVGRREIREARSLLPLDRWLRGTLDLSPGAWIDYEIHTGNSRLDRLVTAARTARRKLHRAQDEALSAMRAAVRECPALSNRDVGVLLGISQQRVHQLRSGHPNGRAPEAPKSDGP